MRNSIQRIDVRQPFLGILHTGTGNVEWPAAKLPPGRRMLLEVFYQHWVLNVFESSLPDATLITLEKQLLPDFVSPMWRTTGFSNEAPAARLSPRAALWDWFQACNQAMLIVGKPGCGKTTALLNLGQRALFHAASDLTQPVPVYVHLASWRGEALDEWLMDQLKRYYFLSQEDARAWIGATPSAETSAGNLLFLLDGLDEVAEGRRQACITAINAFRAQGLGRSMVVASREQAYRQETPLNLENAVRLKPLTLTQVDDFLTQVAPQLTQLRQDLEQHALLWELAQAPLMLQLMVSVYTAEPLLNIDRFDSAEGLAHYLFEQYTTHMFARPTRSDPRTYSEEQTRQTLSWLATVLQKQELSLFQLEDMQPAWLEQPKHIIQYGYLSRIITAVVICLFFDTQFGLITGLASGLLIGLLTHIQFNRLINDKKPLPTKLYFGIAAFIGATITGLPNFYFFRVILTPIVKISALGSVENVTQIALGMVLVLSMVRAVVFGMMFAGLGRGQDLHHDIDRKEELSWSWKEAFRGLMSGFALGLILVMIVVAALGIVAIQLSGIMGGIIVSTGWLVLFGGIYGTLGLFFNGWRGRQKSPDHLNFAGAGLQTTYKNILWTGVTGAILFGILIAAGIGLLILAIIGGAMNQWGVALLLFIPAGLFTGFTLSFTLGGVIGLWYGGVDLIHHYSLRLILRLHHIIPIFSLPNVLNYAVERILILKSGARFQFLHATLQSFFAGESAQSK